MIVITFANRCNALFPQGEVANIQVLDRTRAHTLSYHTSGMYASRHSRFSVGSHELISSKTRIQQLLRQRKQTLMQKEQLSAFYYPIGSASRHSRFPVG